MSLLVSEAIDKMQRKLNSVGQEADDGDFKASLQDAVDYFYLNYELPTAKRVKDIILYPRVREYALPDDFVSLIPPRKAGAEIQSPVFTQGKERDLYRDITQRTMAVEFDRDTPYLVAIDDGNSPLVLSECDSITGVTISGDGADLKVDDRVFVSGSSSIQFTVNPSGGTTTIAFALSNPTDISDNEATIRGFFDLSVPEGSDAMTDVKLLIGNDSSNYFQWTKTTRYRGNAITEGWGVIGAYFEQAALLTQSGDFLLTQDGSQILLQGSVDLTDISYVAIIINHGTDSSVGGTYRIDSIFLSKGNAYELPYYTDEVIKDGDGVTYKSEIEETDDTILLPNKTEGAIIWKGLEYLAAMRKRDSGLANYFARELAPAENELRAKYPRQVAVRVTSWMKPG